MATHETRLAATPFMEQLSDRISAISGTDDFLITGGNVIDPLVGGQANPRDIDVVFKASSDNSLAMRDRLASFGFTFTELRPYRLENKHDIITTTATKDDITLDIAFVNDLITAVGPLDAISLYYDPRENAFIDEHGCLEAISKGRFKCLPTKDFDNENPYMIAGRMIAACAKYDAQVLAQKPTIIDEFNARKEQYCSDHEFSQYAKGTFPVRVLKAIVKTKPASRVDFTTEIIESDILVGVHNQTNECLMRLLGSEASQFALRELSTKTELDKIVAKQSQ